MINALSHLDHGARSLMPQHHRRVDDKWSNAAMGIIVHVRTTDADSMNGDPHHARPDLERQVDFPQTQFMLLFQHQRAYLGHDILLNRPS